MLILALLTLASVAMVSAEAEVPGVDCIGPEGAVAYHGQVSTTVSGHTCQAWNVAEPQANTYSEYYNETSKVTGLGKHNYCRDPKDQYRLPWCYTTSADKRWEQCDLPICGAGREAECMGPGGSYAYRGTLSTTKSGKTCQKWSVAEPQPNTYSKYYTELGLGDNNYCRDPKDQYEQPWCYTTDDNTRWEACDVPVCSNYDLPIGTAEVKIVNRRMLKAKKKEDKSFKIKCSVKLTDITLDDEESADNVEWYKDDVKVEESEDVQINKVKGFYVLYFKKAKVSDSATYRCQFRHGNGVEASAEVAVKVVAK